MRAAAILGPGLSTDILKPFQTHSSVKWHHGLPASKSEAEVILLFGGDGTIHRYLEQLVELELPVLIVPAGSGNDFARALGLHSMRDSIRAWRQFLATSSNTRRIDLGKIIPLQSVDPSSAGQATACVLEPRYFCGVAGVGLDGEVARRANLLPRWLRGHGGYLLSLLAVLFRFPAFNLRVSSANQSAAPVGKSNTDVKQTLGFSWSTRSDEPTILAAFANTPNYGGGMKIAPRACLDDGQLDVCVIGEIDPYKLLCMFPTVYFGRHLGITEVQYFQAQHVRVETEVPKDVYADGEFVCQTPVEIHVAQSALTVIVLERVSNH